MVPPFKLTLVCLSDDADGGVFVKVMALRMAEIRAGVDLAGGNMREMRSGTECQLYLDRYADYTQAALLTRYRYGEECGRLDGRGKRVREE